MKHLMIINEAFNDWWSDYIRNWLIVAQQSLSKQIHQSPIPTIKSGDKILRVSLDPWILPQ